MTKTEPNFLSMVEISQAVREGTLTPTEVIEACLARIQTRDPVIRAWTSLDHDNIRPGASEGRLAGVPFGVKDVIDCTGLPTEMGSDSYKGNKPRYDAGCVGLARAAGAIPLGKTATAEFAGTQHPQTCNPLSNRHTPGGSSSGSAAAVADFMVPFAFGTQTGGSVLRPAAFCGVVGFKPSFGAYPISGMKPAAHSFDTVGTITRSVADVALLHAVLMNSDVMPPTVTPPRIGLFRSHLWDTVTPSAADALERSASLLSKAGAHVKEVALPDGFATITEHRATINAFERARDLAGEWNDARDLMGSEIRATCERGFTISGSNYFAAREAVEAFRAQASTKLFTGVDLLLTPTTPGEAPEGLNWAGDPRLQELWTMLHLPSLSLPFGRGPAGLPLGLQIVGQRFRDDHLLAAAQWIERTLATH
ncbi:amidase [Phaeobacter sp. PT47_59]|uniref:amidase n=1 Tax=Phaeobacter sp. PT47_59 TaxID=3029979 RepID=UPI00237FF62D|nr:amidase [Phaeobacter sp. PT47_59]MDE4175407.1 amidase [Phaeobacter sp. PT47_59]